LAGVYDSHPWFGESCSSPTCKQQDRKQDKTREIVGSDSQVLVNAIAGEVKNAGEY
jgi:hypothetical protein